MLLLLSADVIIRRLLSWMIIQWIQMDIQLERNIRHRQDAGATILASLLFSLQVQAMQKPVGNRCYEDGSSCQEYYP